MTRIPATGTPILDDNELPSMDDFDRAFAVYEKSERDIAAAHLALARDMRGMFDSIVEAFK